MKRPQMVLGALLICIGLPALQLGAEPVELFGFLDQPEQLKAMEGTAFDLAWFAPGARERLKNFHSIIVDQPEFFLAPDSRQKGIKPDALKMLADDFMNAIADEIEGSYLVVGQSGPGVLHLRWALGNVIFKKKWSKNPLKYTPVGATTNAIKKAISDDLTKKVNIADMTIEAEFLDSATGERLAAFAERRKKGEEATSWQELDALMHSYGKLLVCRMDNARKLPTEQVDCLEGTDGS